MKNIIADIAAYITAHASILGSLVYIDMIPTDTGDAMMIRANPGNPVETRSYSKSRHGQFPFSVYARSDDSGKAYDALCALINVLDLEEVNLTDETLVTIEPTSNPALVQKTEGGDYTYLAGFRLDYFTQGGF
jgi:hypothetical protein